MKKVAFTIIFAFLLAACFEINSYAVATKLNSVVADLSSMIQQPIKSWQMTNKLSQEEVFDFNTPSKKFKKAAPGYFWGDTPSVWIRTKYTVPEKILGVPIKGTKISFVANVEDHGEIYVNKELKQQFSRSGGNIVITEKANPGDEYYIVIKVTRNGNYPGLLRVLGIQYAVFEDLQLRVAAFNQSFESLDTVLKVAGEDPQKWVPVLDQAADTIDMEALKNGDKAGFVASLDKCNKVLEPLTKILKKYTMYMIGYSHIDPAWLWDKNEGENIVWKGTSEGILALQKDFPDLIYAANQMHCYRWMENDYPELFKQIQKDIKAGKWEPVGAEWVEPDGNIPAGESYVRQFFYGRKYSKEKLGIVSTVGWTPDSFGYNWNLPQILKKSDMRGFVTQKISWNDTTKFPYNLFWWEAPDGSKILTYFPQGGYGENVDGVVMANQLSNMNAKHGVDSNIVIFGIGDHGGGIPRDYVERAYGFRESPLFPKVEFTTAENVFNKMLEADKSLHFPTWKDELYLEYHRGTYTSQARTKNNNRRNEIRLMNSEKFSTIATIKTGLSYPLGKIEEAWKILLFNQFHDILPGSSITPVYKDADKDHAWIAGQCKEVTDTAMASIMKDADTSGQGIPLVLFNGLSWNRDGVVETPLAAGTTAVSVFDETGAEIPVQIVANTDGSVSAAFFAKNIPAMGYSIYRLVEGRNSTAKAGLLTGDSNMIENDYFKVKVDPKTGWVSSIFDKKNNREIFETGKAGFQLQAYQESKSADAWDPRFPADGGAMVMPDADEVKIVENGPVRITIMAHRKFVEKDDFKSYYSLVAGSPIIYGRLDAEWHDRNIFLKSAFNLNLDSEYATFEIPYATINRVAKPKTPAEKAKWEMSGHKWVDYTNTDKSYGVTLLSFSKYGYDVKDNVLRMTMLRAPTGPDPVADDGFHSIPYALYPHVGDWPGADAPLRGAEYNDPIIAVRADTHSGKLGKSRSFFSAAPHNVVISTIKQAEDGNGFIIRLVETSGIDTKATINLPAQPKKVIETNLVEREIAKLDTPKDIKLEIPISHYEIKSIKVAF